MAREITHEMIGAYSTLVNFSQMLPKFANATAYERALKRAIDILDNADFFASIADARAEMEELAEHERTRSCGCGGQGAHGVDHEEDSS